MKIEVPSIIYDMPTLEYWMNKYPIESRRAEISFKTAVRVYWRTKLSEAQNHKCCYCGFRFSNQTHTKRSATIEHVVPRSQGGADHPDNYVVACAGCNSSRGVMPVENFIPKAQKHILNQIERKKNIEILKAAGIPAGANATASKLRRRVEILEVQKAIAQGLPNSYELNSRKYKTYERYAQMNTDKQQLKAA